MTIQKQLCRSDEQIVFLTQFSFLLLMLVKFFHKLALYIFWLFICLVYFSRSSLVYSKFPFCCSYFPFATILGISIYFLIQWGLETVLDRAAVSSRVVAFVQG